MHKKLGTMFVLAVFACVAASAGAEMAVTHHVDLISINESGIKVMNLGYHATGFRAGTSVQLLGVGAGLNFPNLTDEHGEARVVLLPFVTISIVDISMRLGEARDPIEDIERRWWPGIGAQYTYKIREKDWCFEVGFRFSKKH